MRPQRPIDARARRGLFGLLKQAGSKADFQRVQCLWLRASLGLKHQEVAQAVGWSASRVKQVWSEYFKLGEKALLGTGRGGRRRQNLTLQEEVHNPVDSVSDSGMIRSVVPARFDQLVGHGSAETARGGLHESERSDAGIL